MGMLIMLICLAKHLSESSDVTLIFVTSGDRFTRSILDWDLKNLPFGLTRDQQTVRQYIGGSLEKYLGGSLNLCIARIPGRSIISDWLSMRQNVKNLCAEGNLSWAYIADSVLAVYAKAMQR